MILNDLSFIYYLQSIGGNYIIMGWYSDGESSNVQVLGSAIRSGQLYTWDSNWIY